MPVLVGMDGWYLGRRYPLQNGDTIGRGEGCSVCLGPAERPLFMARFRQEGADAWLETLLPGIAGPLSPAGTLLDLADGVTVTFPDSLHLIYWTSQPEAQPLRVLAGASPDAHCLLAEGAAHKLPRSGGGMRPVGDSAPRPTDDHAGDPTGLEEGVTTERQLPRPALVPQPGVENVRSWMTGEADPGPCSETLPQLPLRGALPARQEEELTATLLMCPRARRQSHLASGGLQAAPLTPVGQGESTRAFSEEPPTDAQLPRSGGAPVPETQLVRRTGSQLPATAGRSRVQKRVDGLQQEGGAAERREKQSGKRPADGRDSPGPPGPAETGQVDCREAARPSRVASHWSEVPVLGIKTGRHEGRGADCGGSFERPASGSPYVQRDGVLPRRGGSRTRPAATSMQRAPRPNPETTPMTWVANEGRPSTSAEAMALQLAPEKKRDESETMWFVSSVKPLVIALGRFLRPGLDRSTAYWMLLGVATGAFLLGARVVLGV